VQVPTPNIQKANINKEQYSEKIQVPKATKQTKNESCFVWREMELSGGRKWSLRITIVDLLEVGIFRTLKTPLATGLLLYKN